ncbi:MAG TPA: phenylacetate--CoA ligase family protein, partial [Gemmataceae bacterium]
MAAGAGPVSDTQRSRLRDLLGEILPANRFYARKLGDVAPDTDLSELPFTTKAELVADQRANPPYGTDLTYPPERYSRFHQTSGTTTGRPLCWLDTPESWERLLDCWLQVYRLVGVGPGDRVFFPFSFGPFLGFWTAFEAASRLGCLCLPAGGMSTT